MFYNKRKDITKLTNAPPPRDFRAEFNQVISQIHAKRTAEDDFGGRLDRLGGPRDMEVVCVKNALKRHDSQPGMGLHCGSILGYSTEQGRSPAQGLTLCLNVNQNPGLGARVEVGEGRSDFAEMKRKLELNLNQSCRFQQHAKRASLKTASEFTSTVTSHVTSHVTSDGTSDGASGSEHDDSDSARGRSASSSGSCHSANDSISGSETDSQQDPDEVLLDKFASECKISLSTAPMKPTVIHIDTPLKENFRDEEFIEANNDVLALGRPDDVYEEVGLVTHTAAKHPNGVHSSTGDSNVEHHDELLDLARVVHHHEVHPLAANPVQSPRPPSPNTESSAVSAWLAKRGVVLEDCDMPRIVSVSRVEEKEDQIKVVKRRFLKHEPKRRRPDPNGSTDSQYSSDESTDAVTSVCSESQDTVILAAPESPTADFEPQASGEVERTPGDGAEHSKGTSASSDREERSESPVPLPVAKSCSPVRAKKSFKAIRAQYERHMAVEDELIEVLPNVRRLAHMFRFEGDTADLKNKYHSLTGRSLSKEFRQKQQKPKPSLPRTAKFDEVLPMERPRTTLGKISEDGETQQEPSKMMANPGKSQKSRADPGSTCSNMCGNVNGGVESKKKKSKSKAAASCKGFFDREILARLSKFQQFIYTR